MKLLALAHAGPERDLLNTTLSAGGADEYEFVDGWEGFMSRLVIDRPAVVILTYSTLTLAGPAGIKAADMTLRALNVATVIALSKTNKDQRFPLEMETEFEHFVLEPYGLPEVRRAINAAMELPTGPWLLATGDEAEAAAAPDVDTEPASAEAAPAVEAGPEPAAAPSPEPATLEAPTEHGAAPPVDEGTNGRNVSPTPLAPVGTAPTAPSFFGSVLDEEELKRVSQGVTAQVDAVSAEDFDSPAVSTVLNAFFDGSPNPEDALPVAEPSAEETQAETSTGAAPTAPVTPPTQRATTKPSAPVADSASQPPETPATQAAPESTAEADRVAPIAADADTEIAPPEETAPAGPDDPAASATSDEESSQSQAETTPSAARAESVSDERRETVIVARSGSVSAERRIPEPRRSSSGSSSDLQLTLSLPDPNNGDLSTVHLPRVLYALAIGRASGELRVKTASLERRLTFLHGEPGTVFKVPTAADESNFLSTFQWTSGTYEFETKEVPEAQFYTFGDPLELIARGIRRHFGLNETATALGTYLTKYVVVTDQLSRFARVLGMEDFAKVARSWDGSSTLEQIMVSAGMETEAVLRHVFFAWLTGVAIFVDEPTAGPLNVGFEIPEVFASAAGSSASGPNAPAARSGVRTGSYNTPPRGEQSGADTAASTEDDTAEQQATFERLQAKWSMMSTVGGYEAFSLKRGCGEKDVNKTFYDLVRAYHPDRFARSHNSQIRSLAEKLFVHIRKVHGELMASETGAPPPPSSAARAPSVGAPAGPTRSSNVASGAQRRRQKSKDHLATSGASPRSYGRIGTDPKKRISEDLKRIRAGQHEPSDDGDLSGENRASSSTMTSIRRMKPEQLYRNARAATEQGNYGKALDLLELAKARGITGRLPDAYHFFLRYTKEEMEAATAIDLIDEIIEELDGKDLEECSTALTLAGHACRLEELPSDALKYYKRASRASAANESAARWLRHLNKRAETDTSTKQGPFSSTFLNKLFTSGKSK